MHEICSKNTTRFWKLCLTSFCVKNYLLPNYKHVLLKNAFCMKSAQRIQLAVENCLTSFCVKNYLFPNFKGVLLKMRFTWNLLKEYNWQFKTVFDFILCKNYILPNYKHVLLKYAFRMKSPKRLQLAVDNCVGLHSVLKTTYCQILGISC